jgi:ATP-dependent exoDNAse (exonuclease V) beta subunit
MGRSQIISVQASAGSGKTYSLAKRYLYLLLSSGADIGIKNIIAVTFTNKAALEMKYRVMSYLKRAALSLDTGDFFEGLKLSRSEISEKSAAVLKDILESYDNFNISTIDSFKNHILRSCALNVGISPNFVIERDYSATLLFSLEVFLRNAQTSENLKEIMRRYLQQYSARDLDWFPKNNIYGEIEKVFEKSGNTGKDILSGGEVSFGDELSSKSQAVFKKIKEFAELLPSLCINKYYSNAVGKVLNAGWKAFFSMDIPPRFACEKLEYRKDAETDPGAELLWNRINWEIKSLCEFYMENYYGVYSDIYSRVAAEFDARSRRDGIVFLNEINKKTVGFFEKGGDVIPEVYCRLSERYRHFLIDEFQDTNLVQWTGIKRFLEESLAGGGTFFYVGDVKQAIYTFRGGNPGIFDMMAEEFPFADIEKRYLRRNFRSGRVLVEFNNGVFSKENVERFLSEVYRDKNFGCGFSKFIETYSFSGQETPEGRNYGYVEIDIIDKTCENVKEEIKQKFIGCVFKCLERFGAQNITVLCRTNEEVFDVSSWLFENGLEVESSQTLNIKNNSCIKQIVSLFMFISSPKDTLSVSSCILCDKFCKVASIESSEFEKFVFAYNGVDKTEIFYKGFRDKYETLWNEYFENFFVQAGFVPVYELALAVLAEFKVVENFPASKAFVMCFLELVKDFETRGSGLKNFLGYFEGLKDDSESLYIKSAFGSGIKIMTVHKAKGLQFPVVIMPFLKLSEKPVDKPYFDDSGSAIKLLSISGSIAKFSQRAREIYEREKVSSLLSELNVLYVSMTRAEYEFYALVPPKSGASNNMVPVLLGGRDLVQGIKRAYSLSSRQEDKIVLDVSTDGYKDIQRYLTNADKIRPDISGVRKRGVIVHCALSRIVSLKNKDMNSVIDGALKFAERKFLFEDVEFLREKLGKLFGSEEILRLFMYDEGYVCNEKEIVDAAGAAFKIDKLITADDEIIIADFKNSNAGRKENKEQVGRYADLVSEIYPGRKISACIVDIEKAAVLACM